MVGLRRSLTWRRVGVLVAISVLALVHTAGPGTAGPPRPGTEDNGLTDNESSTLWSGDADDYITQEEYRQRYGDSRSASHQVANGTDITFTRPPETAATWTRNDFADLTAGGPDMSVHPPSAALADGRFIRDAHATIFAVHPSTRGHLEPGETPLYVAPNGTLRGFVDYRVRVPTRETEDGTTVTWSLVDHEVSAVTLRMGEETLRTQAGSHTPALDYQIENERGVTLTLEAEISVRVQRTEQTAGGEAAVSHRVETQTVSDSIPVEVYDPSAYPFYATYPNGDAGIAVYQTRPWQGFRLTADGNATVRGVWRFYTARNPDWDRLVHSTATDQTRVDSDAIPVFVHAYPSRIGPRAEPLRDGPTLLETWGNDRPSPVGTLGENVHVEVVNRSYTSTAGVAVRAPRLDRDHLRVSGIVRGVTATIRTPTGGSTRELRNSTISAELVEQSPDEATVRISLRDGPTGDPIALDEESRRNPIGGGIRNGTITIAGKRVEPNASGVAIVTLTEPGIYTARYRPGSWLRHDPAYVGDRATVRWHPLGTIEGWLSLALEFLWHLLPFLVMYYAGRRLLLLVAPDETISRKP